MKIRLLFCTLLLGAWSDISHADEAPVVKLQAQGTQIELSESAHKLLAVEALRLVESSNFHSEPRDDRPSYRVHEIQSDYRKTVAGRILVISFSAPRTIKTVGGEISLAEIVVGLNLDDRASSLFTIDESGRVVGHGMYSGQRCVEILKTVKQFAQETKS